jgi:hypothetical protein
MLTPIGHTVTFAFEKKNNLYLCLQTRFHYVCKWNMEVSTVYQVSLYNQPTFFFLREQRITHHSLNTSPLSFLISFYAVLKISPRIFKEAS